MFGKNQSFTLFHNHSQIQQDSMADIDVDDVDFVALQSFIGGKLWTGDKPLYKGLKSKGFEHVITTSELLELRKSL